MEVNGQAAVFDGILFLVVCGTASAALMWAGSIYGDTSVEGYQYMYLNDFEKSSINALAMSEYQAREDGPVRSWLSEVGNYMLGEFNETSERYGAMNQTWQSVCNSAPAPMLLVVSTQDSRVPEERQKLYFACGRLLDHDWGCEGDCDCTDMDETTNSLNVTTLPQEAGGGEPRCEINPYKYPYYASPRKTKNCGLVICDLHAKIYY